MALNLLPRHGCIDCGLLSFVLLELSQNNATVSCWLMLDLPAMLVHHDSPLSLKAAIEIVSHFLLEDKGNLELCINLLSLKHVSRVKEFAVKAEDAILF